MGGGERRRGRDDEEGDELHAVATDRRRVRLPHVDPNVHERPRRTAEREKRT
jgi:hypothetical protein